MTTSRVPAMIAALVTAFGADATLAGLGVAVIDGPKVTGDTGTLALWVGVDEIDGSSPVSANSESEWHPGLARRGRNEQMTVHCTVQAKSGSDDIAPLRANAAAVLAAAESVLLADPSLGGLLRNGDAAITGAEWRTYPASPGMAVRVMFTISGTAITGTP